MLPNAYFLAKFGFAIAENEPPKNLQSFARKKIANNCKREVRSAHFSPDARMIVSGGDDKTVRIWDVESRNDVQSPICAVARFISRSDFRLRFLWLVRFRAGEIVAASATISPAQRKI